MRASTAWRFVVWQTCVLSHAARQRRRAALQSVDARAHARPLAAPLRRNTARDGARSVMAGAAPVCNKDAASRSALLPVWFEAAQKPTAALKSGMRAIWRTTPPLAPFAALAPLSLSPRFPRTRRASAPPRPRAHIAN
eukprot:1631729-Pleurochrysis_carterae.AAC.1